LLSRPLSLSLASSLDSLERIPHLPAQNLALAAFLRSYFCLLSGSPA
jgi:hypothetical protein